MPISDDTKISMSLTLDQWRHIAGMTKWYGIWNSPDLYKEIDKQLAEAVKSFEINEKGIVNVE